MKLLTDREITVLILVVVLLAVGGAVEYYRTAHPPVQVSQQSTP